MQKDIIRYIAILLSFATVMAVFTACAQKDNKSEEKSEKSEEQIKEEQINEYLLIKDDKIYYRKDKEDDYYELATDKNGVTVVDENGNLIWKVTDGQGNDRTYPVSYPSFFVEGNKMACQQFTIKLPKGWESIGNVNFMIKNEAEGKQIDYSFIEKDNKSYKSIEENIKYMEDTFKPLIEDGMAVLTKSSTQVAGRDAVKVVIEIKNDNPSHMEIYYVETSTGIMMFSCLCNYEDEVYDFKAILDTIEYRIK